MKFLLIILFFLFSCISIAGLNYSKDGKVLDPGMYWAIHARNELNDFNKGKGKSSKIMHHLLLSSSYGFKASMLGISAIYQNGDYGFDQDLPRSYAWMQLVSENKKIKFSDRLSFLKKQLSTSQLKESEKILKHLSKTYKQDSTMKKFKKWYREATAVTGSHVQGKHSYLHLQITTSTGRKLTAFEFYNQLDKINDERLDDLYEVVPHEIKIIEDKDSSSQDKK